MSGPRNLSTLEHFHDELKRHGLVRVDAHAVLTTQKMLWVIGTTAKVVYIAENPDWDGPSFKCEVALFHHWGNIRPLDLLRLFRETEVSLRDFLVRLPEVQGTFKTVAEPNSKRELTDVLRAQFVSGVVRPRCW